MKKDKRTGRIRSFFGFLFLLSVPSVAWADVGDILSKFYPAITIQERYTDNFFLTPTNRKEDFITTIYPRLTFSSATTAEPTSGINLDYLLGLNYYARNSDLNYISHAGTLNTWYTFDRRLTLRLREYFLRSEEPVERDYAPTALPNQFLLGNQTGRAVYIRNVAEPSVGYQFGREDRIDLYYRNNTYQNRNPNFENSQENYINPRFTYWFNIRNGITLEYALTQGQFERSADFLGHLARSRYTYRFDPRTSIFGEYIYHRRDFESPGVDYDIHNPSVGVEHAFNPTLRGRAQLGYFWQRPEIGSTQTGFSYNAGLTQATEKTTYDLTVQGGYTEVYFTAQNLGFTKYNGAIGTITRRLERRTTLGVYGSITRADYTDANRVDRIWRVGGSISYMPLRWLNTSLEAYHAENNATVDSADYRETSIFFRVTAFYGTPGQAPPQFPFQISSQMETPSSTPSTRYP